MTENKIWRPSKLSEQRLNKAKEVLADEDKAVILTDDELFFLINDWLEQEYKVTERTFQSWKSKSIKCGSEEEIEEEYWRLFVEFLRLIKKALVNQKNCLYKELKDKENWQWQRIAWIIERKFTDWNLKVISENRNDNTNKNYEAKSLSELYEESNKDN